jgi:hypothetical protein
VEDPVQNQANEKELDHGASRGHEEASSQVEAEERRDGAIDQDQKGGETDLVVVDRYKTHK